MGNHLFVGPVADPGAALKLEYAGASVIGLAFYELPRYPVNTRVDLSLGQVISSALSSAELCVSLDARKDIELQRKWCALLEPDYVAIDLRQADTSQLLTITRSIKAKIILMGLVLDYDEDPQWLSERLRSLVSDWDLFAVVLTLLPGLKRPVQWLQEESGACEEDVVLGDIETILASFPVLVNMELDKRDFPWVKQRFSSALGFFFFLGGGRDDGGAPVFSDLETTTSLLSKFTRHAE